MKNLFTFLLIALVAISVNAAGVMICGKVYNENSYQLINQELADAGYLKSGSIAYDPVNYKLTLNNADILCDKTIIETYQLEYLEIEVIGNCTALIDIIMNSGTGAAADVNEDGDIDVRDITALIDIIMNN